MDRLKAWGVYLLAMHGCATMIHTGMESSDRYGSEVGQKNGKKMFFRTGLPQVSAGQLGATVEFSQSVWTVRKPKVSTHLICMTVPGLSTPAWSGRSIMGRRLVLVWRVFN